jgi:hypothetical protein
MKSAKKETVSVFVRHRRCLLLCVSQDESAECFENACFGYSACESSTTATADRARKRWWEREPTAIDADPGC